MSHNGACKFRHSSLALTISMMASTSILSPLASAQDAQDIRIEEILVTAQKRVENLQDVPISVAALSGESLGVMFEGGADVRALSARVPGLYVESSNGRVAPRFYIRGLGNSDFDLAASQPVSVVMDEVAMENVILKSFPIFDIEQVEVLRGPQGSLFGRNTTAGIVKFNSRKPTFEQNGYAQFGIGQYGTVNFEGAVGGGLSDNVAMRISALYQNREDWIDNDFTGQSDAIGGFTEKAGRVQLLFSPTDQLDVLLNLHARSLEGTSSVFRANIFDAGDDGLNSNYDRDTVYYNEGDNNPQEYESKGFSLNVEYDLGEFSLTSITAYENADGRSLGDIDGGNPAGPGFIPFQSQTEDAVDDLKQFSQEIRLASNNDGPFNWQTGFFFFDSELDVTTTPFFIPPTSVSHENTTWAVFAQGNYDLTDELTLTAGLRYTDDEKDFSAPGYKVDTEDDKISGDLSLNYALTDTTTVYSRLATGFRAPTIQGRDVAFGQPPSSADSETITSFEVGVKAEIASRARINAAAFIYEIDDMQFTAIGGSFNAVQLVNARQGEAMGVEVDFEWLVTDNIEITAGFSYSDTEIDDSNLRVQPCGSGACTVTDPVIGGFALVDGNAFPNAPETTFNFTASYTYPLTDDAELFAFTDWAFQGKTQIFLYEAREFETDDQFEGGLRFGYRKNDGSLTVAAFGRNITDEENIQGAIDFNNLTGFTNEPRIWGLQVSSSF